MPPPTRLGQVEVATISDTRSGMPGKAGKPFCGNCCAEFRPGQGKARKRVGKKLQKRREAARWRRESEQELEDASCTHTSTLDGNGAGSWWRDDPWGASDSAW